MDARGMVSVALVGSLLVVSAALPADTPEAGDAGKTNTVAGGGTVIKEHRSGEWTPELTDAEKETIFAIAMDTLEWCTKGSKGEFDFSKYQLTEKLKKDTATFVTLKVKVGGDLRGCIGSLEPHEALYLSVYNNAVNAALNDSRFDKVKSSELAGLDVHVSILSPIKDIASIDEFKLGEHGIILTKMGLRSVFLPEVAIEQKWTREQTLSHLSRKAGMPNDAWKQGAKFKVFSSVVLAR
jgi:AmmeMemoRadiSam system protein A